MRSMTLVLAGLLAAGCGVPLGKTLEATPAFPVEVLPPVLKADGTVGAWELAPKLPVARANHCAVAVGDWLVVAGGNYKPAGSPDFVTLDDVVAAQVTKDGAALVWRDAGHLPSAGLDCVLASTGRTVVLLGGLFDDTSVNGTVWTATLSQTGTLTAWQEVGVTPYGRRVLTAGAAIRGTTVWLTDSLLASEGTATAIVASATLGTTLGPWTKTDYWPGFRNEPLGAFTDDAVFIIGGYGDGSGAGLETNVIGAPLGAGAPAATTPFPEARMFGAGAAVDGFVFATGGRTQLVGGATSTVYSAKATGATLGQWTPQVPLPEARSNHTATVVGEWLFIVGGGNGGPGLDLVYRSRVRHPLP